MNKQFLTKLLDEYEHRKGWGRRYIYGDDLYIKKLRFFVETNLVRYQPSDPIKGTELAMLYAMLRARLASLKTDDQYRNNHSLPNHIFHKLIFQIAQNSYAAKQSANPPPTAASTPPTVASSWFWDTRPGKIITEGIAIGKWGMQSLTPSFGERLWTQIQSWWQPAATNTATTSTAPPTPPPPRDDVITNFSYQAVLGQLNPQTIFLEPLEEVDPTLLALTDSGHILSAEELVGTYQATRYFTNPHDSTNQPLSAHFLQRIAITKPFFKQALNTAILGRHVASALNSTSLFAPTRIARPQELVEMIRNTGEIMLTDRSPAPYEISNNALLRLRDYIYSLPPSLKDPLLAFTMNGDLESSLGSILTQHDICRHTIGAGLTHIARVLRSFSVGLSPNELIITATVPDAAAVDGLRI